MAEPLYQSIVSGALLDVRLHFVDDPRDWSAASRVLDSWNWP
ncbi:hypothetical protein [Streptosporangium saharense]